jgi:ppGpp synthetase/RelA/SpoT-type nucleotidyltranferase
MDRPTFDQYLEWTVQTLHADWGDARYRRLYDANVITALNTVQSHPFFQKLDSVLSSASQQYNPEKPDQLLTHGPTVHLVSKPFDSVIDKSFRRNVLKNDNFDNPPADGWCCPDNPFGTLNDTIRGLTVCRYIDGPLHVCQNLARHADACDLESSYKSRQDDTGYYAYHFYIRIPVQLMKPDLEQLQVALSVELQVTTQLQEVLKDLTHGFYEEIRTRQNASTDDWKWRYDTPRFRGSYIGHTLHLLEGIIVDLKDDVSGAKGKASDDQN